MAAMTCPCMVADKPEQPLARMKGHRAYSNRHKNPFT